MNTDFKGFSENIAELTAKAQALRESMESYIDTALAGLEDNPGIQRIGKNCFIMNSSALSLNDFSAQYYDFKRTYEIIASQLKSKELIDIVPYLKEILKAKRLEYYKNGHKHKINLHPKVIGNINKLVNNIS